MNVVEGDEENYQEEVIREKEDENDGEPRLPNIEQGIHRA